MSDDVKATTNPLGQYDLPSHYSDTARAILKKMILEDFGALGVKLPTYCNLVARHISNTGVSEDWLSKLSHQTVSKLLDGKSTPRYPVWACLHLYLHIKQGPIELSRVKSRAELFGESLGKFADTAPPEAAIYSLSGTERLEITDADDQAFSYAKIEETFSISRQGAYAVRIIHYWEGVAARQAGEVTLIMRGTLTPVLRTQHVRLDDKAGTS
jgi:hypothetical protein